MSEDNCGETCKRATLCYACSKELNKDKPARPRLPTAQQDLMGNPYAWGRTEGKYSDIVSDGGMDPRNIKPKTEWQGLTFADIDDLAVSMDWTDIDDVAVSKAWLAGARWAEAKLKEKNK